MVNANKGIKRIISISAAALCMLASFNPLTVSYNEIEADAASVMTAWEITEDMKMGWNLGNTFDSYVTNKDGSHPENLGLEVESAWGQPVTTREMIHAVKAKGFNTIRVPVTWFQHVDKNNNFKIDDAWLARVKEVVDWCLDEGLYVILNMHHEEGWQNSSTLANDYERIKPFVTSVWTQLANTFKDYDQHLVFEAMNEPRAVGQPHEWWTNNPNLPEFDVINKLNADILGVIRGTGDDNNDSRLVMLPSYCAGSDPTFMNANKIPQGDSYVAASVHAYSPYDFTMNSEVADHSKFTAKWKGELESCLNTVKTTFIDKGVPVVIGEMSSSNYGNLDARLSWADTYASTAKAIGIPCVLWDNNVITDEKTPGECHGYFNRSELTWYKESVPVVDKLLGIFNDSSIPWGVAPEKPPIEHEDINSGNVIFKGPKEIDKALADTYQDSIALDMTFDKLDGKDVAIQFTGDAPAVAISDANWGGWTEINPYDVDKEKGIAYFSMDQLKESWTGDISNVAHFSIKTNGKTNVIIASTIKAAEIDLPVSKVKKYQLDLSARKDTDKKLVVTFSGTPGAVIEGCVQYEKDGEWPQATFKDAIGADGKFVFEVALGDGENAIPSGITKAETQIWYCDDEAATMDGYEIVGESAPVVTTTTAAPVVTTTTTTTSAVPVVTTTTTTPPQPATMYGDANNDGKISIGDAVLILQYCANKDKYGVNGYADDRITPQGEKNADCFEPGSDITPKDALAVQLKLVGSVAALPIMDVLPAMAD